MDFVRIIIISLHMHLMLFLHSIHCKLYFYVHAHTHSHVSEPTLRHVHLSSLGTFMVTAVVESPPGPQLYSWHGFLVSIKHPLLLQLSGTLKVDTGEVLTYFRPCHSHVHCLCTANCPISCEKVECLMLSGGMKFLT